METLRTFGHYSIVSEKVDRCPCKDGDFLELTTMGVGFFSALFFVMSSSVNALTFALSFFVIGCVGFFGGIIISDSTYECGVKIRLKDNNYNDCTVKSISYQFTNNPETDALEIKKIMDDFEEYANKIDIATKTREEEESKIKKECCNKYKSVIQKVK
jgi:hypothetical protein